MSIISEPSSNRRLFMKRSYRPTAGFSGNRSVIGAGCNIDRQFLCQQFSNSTPYEDVSQNTIMEERWADENTTVVTGATSDAGGNEDGQTFYQPLTFSPFPKQSLIQLTARRCSWLCWLCFVFLNSFSALVSAPLMIAIPIALNYFGPSTDTQLVYICEVDCQGQLLNLSGKTALLLLALYVLLWRRSGADMPRLFLYRTAFAFFVFFVLFAFWLFYIVRILLERNAYQTYILSFALSLLDILLFIHCIWIFFELRQLRPVYRVQIVRDPDGEWRQHEIGQMTIQEAAVVLLRLYHVHFPLFNSYLDQRRRSMAVGRFRVNPPSSGFKLYDIDGRGDDVVLSEINARILMKAASQRRLSGHNELFHEEYEWERRYRKRKCRLIGCTEEIFAQVKATTTNIVKEKDKANGQMVESMDPQNAAKAIFSSISKQLNRFLRFSRQERLHTNADISAYLQRCLAFGFSARTFLQRFFADAIPIQETMVESNWSIICSDCRVSSPLRHGHSFVLRCHDQGGVDQGVHLLCTVSAFPFLNLTEQSTSNKSSFQLKVIPGNAASDDLGV